MPSKLVVSVPVAPSTSMLSMPPLMPMPFSRSTAEMTAPFSPRSARKSGIAGFVPSPQIQRESAVFFPAARRAALTG